ncbi:crotonobetainyl-CoA:carnitine CoA-transferase CaiB-like acyl-CoA transferase [Cupriavidus metallidurans]|jgi:crotonobetainyl-CoA:carnitine CoA-transferase CaiB-like acyl-CoA transferase|uniref:L-carnitine dehydratase/bile acid-inducible protein F n=1 Tax=Cupriavidus metallidurans (strain ATCC 43123 / DSM 2839 / NBRC 102507 / CH34) TaxID=266264 RepID=Q1LJ55_CUPMC|nr:CoA transferase [Cupriavidus metallidurans]ABF09821.1 L-carnitine dehydratase/bile acid-inducible protein F [Cupriavidus metallidurans CH34]KWW34651.1 Acetyl-CoA:oxalate CoA-transferase [Cupriavidus metallidurans]MDE4919351.1 CoA transferase [Cupriavidus metallidurans]QGS29352.1 CoA transferase [Cupriavidus metallidurans]
MQQTIEPSKDTELPLDGVRVLDLSRVFAGPLCGQVLADFGAEVVKVEHPGRGDDTRDWGMRIGKTETTYYNSMNRNKRSITLDLQSKEGVQIVYELLPKFDVVIHNFKTGGAEKLGLGYEQLKAIKPDLIYCAISGYDTSGPEAKRPGYDLVIQGEAGLMALNGEADQPPLKFGVAVVDLMTGMYAAQAVLAALFRRERKGLGQLIEMALYDCGVMVTGYYGLDAMLLGRDPARYGNAHPSIVPYGMFEAADGPLIIAVGNNNQFDKFCRQVIERPDIVEDPRYATNVERAKNRVTLTPLITGLIHAFPRDLLLERMTACGIPCGRVAGLHEALTSERTRRGGLMREMPHPVAGTTHVFAPPYRLDGKRPPIRNAPPTLGEGTRAVLQSLLDMSDAQLQELQALGVLTLPEAPANS